MLAASGSGEDCSGPPRPDLRRAGNEPPPPPRRRPRGGDRARQHPPNPASYSLPAASS